MPTCAPLRPTKAVTTRRTTDTTACPSQIGCLGGPILMARPCATLVPIPIFDFCEATALDEH